jgi:diacylglycerol kinase (ATP)
MLGRGMQMIQAIWLKCQAATLASIGGIDRVMKEVAFRYELVSYGVSLVLFTYIGATWQQIWLLTGLALGVFAIEAINTAIEVIVDHLSPEWSEMAKQAKDLGSFAVSCMLLISAVYVISVCWG